MSVSTSIWRVSSVAWRCVVSRIFPVHMLVANTCAERVRIYTRIYDRTHAVTTNEENGKKNWQRVCVSICLHDKYEIKTTIGLRVYNACYHNHYRARKMTVRWWFSRQPRFSLWNHALTALVALVLFLYFVSSSANLIAPGWQETSVLQYAEIGGR